MKKQFALILLLVTIAISGVLAQGQEERPVEKTYTIGVSKMMSHPALDSIEQGMKEYLDGSGIKIHYDFQNCNGEVSTAISIAQAFKSEGVDIAVGIATVPAQALMTVFKDIPVVFGAISDPLAAGLVATYDRTEQTNVCGVSDMNPIALQLETFFQVAGIRRLGMVYTSGEANAVAQMEEARKACAALDVEFVSAAVANSAEVKMACQSIIDRVDGMYVAIDNTVVSAIASVDEVCRKARKPLFNSDTTSSRNTDFFMAWSFNYHTVGIETGRVVERIIRGENPKDIGAVFFDDPSQFDLVFNLDSAGYLGIAIDDELREKASYLVENGEFIPTK